MPIPSHPLDKKENAESEKHCQGTPVGREAQGHYIEGMQSRVRFAGTVLRRAGIPPRWSFCLRAKILNAADESDNTKPSGKH